MGLFAIPDIHGHLSKLDDVLARVDAYAGTEARIVFLGDLVDRGPDSFGVVQRLIDGIAAGRDWIVLRGNHDQMFLKFIEAAQRGGPLNKAGSHWLNGNLGGVDTLTSYGVFASDFDVDLRDAAAAIPDNHRTFLADLPYKFETDDLLFVHAGIFPGIPFEQQDPEDLIWIRNEFLYDTRDHGKLVVHGHTPCDYPMHCGNRINLDGGAGWGRELFVAKFQNRDCWLLTDDGRVPLTPPTEAY